MWRARVLRVALLITAALVGGPAAMAQTGLDAVGGPAARRAAPTVVGSTVPVRASGVAIGPDPDPYEKLNRKSYALFRYLDRHAIRPASVFYAHAVPKVARTGLHNAIQNVGEPVIFFNDVLQLHPTAAAQTLGRFAINSTIGVAGLGDPATAEGVPYHQNSFGTTMGRYGVPAGPFLFIPVLGPSDVRDLVGGGVDTLTDPLTWISYTGRFAVNASRTVVSGLDTRANADPQLKQLDALATDPYASLRSLYLQNRQAQITRGPGQRQRPARLRAPLPARRTKRASRARRRPPSVRPEPPPPCRASPPPPPPSRRPPTRLLSPDRIAAMTDIRRITADFSVAPQLSPAEVADVAALGFHLLINNRPDQEAPGQPTSLAMAEAARTAGVNYLHIPVGGGSGPGQAGAMHEAVKGSDGPVLAFCRSGTRSITTWAIGQAEAGVRSRDELIALGRSAGYDLSASI